MAKKRYTGAKVMVVAASAAALVYGTAWFSLAPKQQAEAATSAASQPANTSSTTSSVAAASVAVQSTTSTMPAPQAVAPRAKRSRGS